MRESDTGFNTGEPSLILKRTASEEEACAKNLYKLLKKNLQAQNELQNEILVLRQKFMSITSSVDVGGRAESASKKHNSSNGFKLLQAINEENQRQRPSSTENTANSIDSALNCNKNSNNRNRQIKCVQDEQENQYGLGTNGRNVANIQPKSNQKSTKNNQKSTKNQPKIN